MRHVSLHAESIRQRQLKVRLPFTLFIYPVALLAILTIGSGYLRSFVSSANSEAAVQPSAANHAKFAFLNSAVVPSRESVPGSRLLSVMSDSKRNNPDTSNLFGVYAPPTPQLGSSKIVFASNREGSMQLYVMNSDGSGVARLTNSGANDDFPRWSPNGAKILFQSDRDNPFSGNYDIYVMNADGSGVARLTSDPNDDSVASWSPDGSNIVFQSLRNGVGYQVYSMNADGSNQVCLTNTSSSDGEPSWFPDGTKIAFASDRDHAGSYSVYVMNSDGSGQQGLTFSANGVDDRQPAWSPDGTKIAFVSTRDSTTETWQETDDLEIPEDDGQILTKSVVHINKEVYVMNNDGSSQTRLTNELANDDSPSWSPDGSKIVFRSDRERDCCDPIAQVWTMNADGTSQTDLSNSGNGDYIASWTFGGVIDTPFSGGTRETPVANTGGPYNSQTGQVVQLNGSGSFDPNGTITNYSWDFGDGTSSTGVVVNHQYNAAGVYSVSLAVTDNNGNTASSQGFVSVDSVSFPVKINFDDLPNNTAVTDQYLNQYGVRFYSDNLLYPAHTWQRCGDFCSTTSLPNYIWTGPNITGQTIAEFAQPVSNLSFFIIGIDVFFDPFAVIDVYRNNAFYGSFTVSGNGTATKQISFGPLDNINKIVIRSISDPFGIGFDDFSFNVPADVKITSGRVNGYLNGTTQNALLGADVALNASPLPGAFAGGTYAWTCTPAQLCPILGSPNSSSVTLRANEVGTFTATVSYTKNGLTTSGSFTINSVIPTLTRFAGQQATDRITPSGGDLLQPGPCHDVIGFWRYILGCRGTDNGMFFSASVHTNTFISDPAQSRIKYVQAVSAYRKMVQSGNLLCETNRSDPTDITSGWQLDTSDPYSKETVHKFSEGNDLTIEDVDYPSVALTLVTDYEMVDSLYIDDQFEMYLVYFAVDPNLPDAPRLQRPIGKLAWNWGGLVAFDWDWNILNAFHRIRSLNTIPGPRVGGPTNSMVSMQGNVNSDRYVACPGTGITHNLIDSSRVFVRFHYKDFLGRDPDGNPDDPNDPNHPTDLIGWKFWTSEISHCVFDFDCIHVHRINDGLSFFLSAEFVGSDPDMANPPGSPNFNPAVYNRAFVRHCYNAYLHREPEPGGWDFWTNDLNSNGDYRHMIDSFQVSTEYRGRIDFTIVGEKF